MDEAKLKTVLTPVVLRLIEEKYFRSMVKTLLIQWCDKGLGPGKAYGTSKNADPFPPKDGKLIYQDGTACSASHAMSDIYLLPDGKYIIQTDIGRTFEMGGEYEMNYSGMKYETILDVLDGLLKFCFHDPNSTGDFFQSFQGYIKQDAINNGLFPIDDAKNFNKKYNNFSEIIKEPTFRPFMLDMLELSIKNFDSYN